MTEEKEPNCNVSTWVRAARSPTTSFANPVVLDENFIIFSPYGKNEYLRKYDIMKDAWSAYIPYPTEINIKFHSIALDRETGKIYLYDGADRVFVEFDVHKQLVTKCKKKKQIVGNGKFCTSMVYNKVFYVIGGTDKDRMLVWLPMEQKFEEHDMPQPSPAGHSCVLLTNVASGNSQHSDFADNPRIVIFGGNESIKFQKYMDVIYICDLHPEISWRRLKSIKMPHKMYFFGCIQYKASWIIIFGGKQKGSTKDEKGLSDEIWVLHLKTWKWSRAHLKCPKKAKYYAVITDQGMVHLFEYEGNGGHWKIPISIIINQSSTQFMQSTELNRNVSLSQQVDQLTRKINTLAEENEKLVEAQKDYKQKLKTLKSKNKQLTEENEELQEEVESLKAQQTGSTKTKKTRPKATAAPLLEAPANDLMANYQDINAKLQKLQTAKVAVNVNQNGHQNNNNAANPFLSDAGLGGTGTPVFGTENPFGEDYEFWGYEDVVEWINNLENGKYRKYLNDIRYNAQQRNIDGHTFVNFELKDLRSIGVNNYNDAVSLLRNIKALKTPYAANNNNNAGNNNVSNTNTNMNTNNNTNNTTDIFDSFFN
mmetsp:Transcript_31440/g.50588  ORF Transcript_31440/g.50588 Transcript_31440/m.50588 type:complete len:594 (-) Transcript_31440:192-1973(-)|eukprot:CAMPEP_0197043414 /NCGR_PEP_ID=MMETSP1384-20130603/19667_1 /TAXON_ID=29189 /ORGANISM="Ammonia sp." /LENGTH=593 /DNA_ID=CAMNT_0042474715 /DNA_START=64 /DNA_END=1845 /DNA_ORIENTATION=-